MAMLKLHSIIDLFAAVDPQVHDGLVYGMVCGDRAEVVYRHLCLGWVLWLNCYAIFVKSLHLAILKTESKTIHSGLVSPSPFLVISVQLIIYHPRRLLLSFLSTCYKGSQTVMSELRMCTFYWHAQSMPFKVLSVNLSQFTHDLAFLTSKQIRQNYSIKW